MKPYLRVSPSLDITHLGTKFLSHKFWGAYLNHIQTTADGYRKFDLKKSAENSWIAIWSVQCITIYTHRIAMSRITLCCKVFVWRFSFRKYWDNIPEILRKQSIVFFVSVHSTIECLQTQSISPNRTSEWHLHALNWIEHVFTELRRVIC